MGLYTDGRYCAIGKRLLGDSSVLAKCLLLLIKATCKLLTYFGQISLIIPESNLVYTYKFKQSIWERAVDIYIVGMESHVLSKLFWLNCNVYRHRDYDDACKFLLYRPAPTRSLSMFQSMTSVGAQGGERHLPAKSVLMTMAMAHTLRTSSASVKDD